MWLATGGYTAGFRDARDDRARGAHLGGGREKVGIGGKRKCDRGERVLCSDAALIEGPGIANERGCQIGEFLRLAGAGLVRDRGVDEDRRQGKA